MASPMTDLREILKDVQDDLAIAQAMVESLAEDNKQHIRENERLTFENGALRERLRLSEEVNYSDDLADARRDRERDLEWAKSEDFQARGER